MMLEQSLTEELNNVFANEEFRLMSEKLDDESFDFMMSTVEKIISKPNVPASKVEELILQMQAVSAGFQMKANWYKNFGRKGDVERYKKDAYMSAYDACDKLVNALKYISKAQVAGVRAFTP